MYLATEQISVWRSFAFLLCLSWQGIPIQAGQLDEHAMSAGEFYTDPQFAASMRDTFESWYIYGMDALKVSFLSKHVFQWTMDPSVARQL